MAQKDDLSQIAEQYNDCNEHVDIKKFVEYHRGEIADSTLIQYIRYLSDLDFNPLKETTKIEEFDEWTREKSRSDDKFGKDSHKRNSRDRYRYFSYLALKKYLKARGRKELINKIPTESFEPPKSKKQKIYYNREQIEKLREKAESSDLRLAITLMFYSGLRTYEVLNITPEWFDFFEEGIKITIPPEYAKASRKNIEEEETFLDSRFEDEIKEYIKNHYNADGEYQELYKELEEEEGFEPLIEFVDGSDKGFMDLARERYAMYRELRKLAEKSGINKASRITPHKLRKSFIHHISDDLDLEKVSDLARHGSTDLTKNYYLQQEDEEKLNNYNKAFS